MTKNDRKQDSSSSKKNGKFTFKSLLPGDEKLQRSLLLIALVALLTFIIVPKGALTPTSFSSGDVAPRDIKASHDLLIPDEELTEQKRAEAEKLVPQLYDFDPQAGLPIFEQVSQILTFLHDQEVVEQSSDEIVAELSADFGVKLKAKDFEPLMSLAQREDSTQRVQKLIVSIYRQKVAANLKLFEADRSRGVIFRSVETQSEQTDGGRAKVVGLGSLQDSLKAALAETEFSATQQRVLRSLITPLLRPNISFNQNETELRKELARDEVQPVLIQVKKSEMIVREGDRISDEQMKKLDAFRQDGERVNLWRTIAGLLCSSFLLIYFTHTYARRNIRKYDLTNHDLFFLSLVFVGQILALKIAIFVSTALSSAFPYVEQTAYYYIFPFAVGTMLVRVVLNSEIALIFAVLSAFLIGVLFGKNYSMMMFAFLTSLAAAHWVRQVTERSSLFRAGLRLGMFNFALIFALHLTTVKPFDLQLIYKLLFGFSGGLAAAVVVTGIVPLVESLFRYTTNIKLLELANMNNPLLRDLMVQAPGTYHHSIVVGNLAEAAAENIGVNPLMVRVAAYYHDIGKTRKPLYFIENIRGLDNKHDKLTSSMSALILMAHVRDGVEMAREQQLGQSICDIIRQHHGTSLMKFFYDKAKSKVDPGVEQINERDYRYPGPKPQSREAALIMLADAVEAASRTLTDPTPARIQGMVQKIVNNIFIDGQLDECELTLKDMHNIAKSFNLVLGGIFHHRVDYPEPVSKERVSEKTQKKSDEDRDRKPAKEGKNSEAAAEESGAEDLKRLGMS